MSTAMATTSGSSLPAQAMVQFDRERIDLIKKTVCPQGIPDAAFALFIEQCKRSGLDPLIKQAFCVARKANVGGRDNPKWVEKYEFQPSEAGMLARAEAFPDFRGVTAAPVYEHDECSIDAGAGVVSHRFSITKRGQLLGAWARVAREGRDAIIKWLDLGAYQQKTSMWDRMAPTMIEKCARVAVLRQAYPSAFGGLYIADEMPPAEVVEPAQAQQVQQRQESPQGTRQAHQGGAQAAHGQVVEAEVVEEAPAPQAAPVDPLAGERAYWRQRFLDCAMGDAVKVGKEATKKHAKGSALYPEIVAMYKARAAMDDAESEAQANRDERAAGAAPAVGSAA